MGEYLSQQEQREQERFARMVADELAAGKSRAKIAEKLIEHGCPSYDVAIGFVRNVEQAMLEYGRTPQGRAGAYAGTMVAGIIMVVVGLAISLGSYLLSETIGLPVYVIAGGAIIFGIIGFFKGLFGFIWNSM